MKVRFKLVHWMLAVAVCGVALFGYSCLKKRAYFTKGCQKHKGASLRYKAQISQIKGYIFKYEQIRRRNPTATFGDSSLYDEYNEQIAEATRRQKSEEEMMRYYEQARRLPWLY